MTDAEHIDQTVRRIKGSLVTKFERDPRVRKNELRGTVRSDRPDSGDRGNDRGCGDKTVTCARVVELEHLPWRRWTNEINSGRSQLIICRAI